MEVNRETLKSLFFYLTKKGNENRYWCLCFCLLVVFGITTLEYPNLYGYGGYDFWEHTAALNELSYHLLSPKDPMLVSDATSIRYMPYILFLALFKKITGLSVFTIMSLASIATFLIFSSGLYFFITEYFQDKDQAFYTIIILLFFWGTGFMWAGEYSFNLLKLTLCYPAIFSFSLSFFGFYFILRYIKTNNLKNYLFSIVLGIIIFVTHPLTGSFFFLSVVLIGICERKDNLKTEIAVLGIPIIVFFFSCFWPYFSMTDLMFGSMGREEWGSSMFYSPQVIYQIGPALLGIPIVFNYIIKKEYKFVYYGFASCFFIYILTGIMKISMGSRYIFFIVFFLHLAIAREFRVRNLLSFSTIKHVFCSSDRRKWIDMFLILILFTSIVFNVGLAYARYFADQEKDKIVIHGYDYGHIDFKGYNFLKEKVGRYEVVMSDRRTSWLIPSFSGKAVCLLHVNPFIPDLEERSDGVETFFDAKTTSETRVKILKKYKVSHILLNLDLELFDDETIAAITELGNITFQNCHFILIEPTNFDADLWAND